MNQLSYIKLKGSYLICHIDGKKTFFLLPQGLVQKDKGIDFFLDGETLIAKLNGEESQEQAQSLRSLARVPGSTRILSNTNVVRKSIFIVWIGYT